MALQNKMGVPMQNDPFTILSGQNKRSLDEYAYALELRQDKKYKYWAGDDER